MEARLTSIPDPLTPADCDLRDFAFMPLDVARLRDSDLASNESPEACWAAVLLWAASWHQVPAASIPNDDKWLAQQTGYGRIVKEWIKVRSGALRGWMECSDGRLYHPVVVEKALDAWDAKRKQRWKTECARIKKHNDRHETKHPIPSFDEWLSLGCPSGQLLSVPRDKVQCPDKVPRETPSKGQGEGQGYISKEESLSNSATDGGDFEKNKSEAKDIAEMLGRYGMPDVSPNHPDLTALIEKGVDLAMFEDAAKKTNGKGSPFPYVVTVLTNLLKSSQSIADLPAVGAVQWDRDRVTVEAEGVRLGLGKWDDKVLINRELFTDYVERVRVAREGVAA